MKVGPTAFCFKTVGPGEVEELDHTTEASHSINTYESDIDPDSLGFSASHGKPSVCLGPQTESARGLEV